MERLPTADYFDRSYRAHPGWVSEMLADVDAWGSRNRLSGPCRNRIKLILDEYAANLHRYGDLRPDEEACRLRLEWSDRRVTIRLDDRTAPFDLLALPSPDTSAPLEQRRPGGLGVHLIRQLADEIAYRREDGQNRITILLMVPEAERGE